MIIAGTTGRSRLARGLRTAVCVAGVLAGGATGCGGGSADSSPNPNLDIPKSTSDPNAKPDRGAKAPPKK